MKERDYIAVQTLTTIRHAEALLRGITADINPDIDRPSYQQILATLQNWEAKLLKRITG